MRSPTLRAPQLTCGTAGVCHLSSPILEEHSQFHDGQTRLLESNTKIRADLGDDKLTA